MRIRAQLHLMAANEIARMIPADVMADIKRDDPKPLFKAFVVGHEGESKGNLVGVGNVIKRWFKTMIHRLADKIQAGLQLFHGHAATNDHAGRIPIGKVVGKKLADIDGRESVVVACYINKEFNRLPLDVASVEVDVDFEQTAQGVDITDISQVTGIALGNRAVETPGFPGATLLGQLQAFAKEKNIDIGHEIPRLFQLGYHIKKTDQPKALRLV